VDVLPPEIGQLASLQQLSLNGNQLTVLPPGIADLLDSELSFSAEDNNGRNPSRN
jgi:Leucine-rich repeat (LRR) protein